MFNAFFDTNVLLDAVDPNRPHSDEACNAMQLCNEGYEIRGYTCPLSLKDSYYILTKAWGEKSAREAVKWLMGLLIVTPVSSEECDMSLRDGEPDFEDGLIRATAELEGMDYIITRDTSAFVGSKVPAITAAEFAKIVAAAG